MNFDTKISKVYLEYLQQRVPVIKKTPTNQNLVKSSQELFSKEGLKLESIEEQFDDALVNLPMGAQMIMMKLKDKRLIQCLTKECEAIAKEAPPAVQDNRFKFDFCENEVI